jgi:hypothetical protein
MFGMLSPSGEKKMKTIIDGHNEIRRVHDDHADKMVATGLWHYCPKRLWKRSTLPEWVLAIPEKDRKALGDRVALRQLRNPVEGY